MNSYFDMENSANNRTGGDIDSILNLIGQRYIAQNPALPFVFRAFNQKGILCDADGRYNINLNERFITSKIGQISYAMAKVWCDTEKTIDLSLSCYGPVSIYLNGIKIFRSSFHIENNHKHKATVKTNLKIGWNTIIIKCKKTASGFGCIFGSGSSKWLTFNAFTPFKERNGEFGWIYSEVLDEDIYKEDNLPQYNISEVETGIRWYPERQSLSDRNDSHELSEIFGREINRIAFAWSKINVPVSDKGSYAFEGTNNCKIEIWINNEICYTCEKSGKFNFSIDLKPGKHDIVVKSYSIQEGNWNFSIKEVSEKSGCTFCLPYPVKGARGAWLYLGTFSPEYDIQDVGYIQNMYTLFENDEGGTYWRTDEADVWVRPFLENELFGRWNYPLGVTLFGLLQAGRHLNRKDIVDYAVKHVTECTKLYKYAIWEKSRYGYSGIDAQIVEVSSLDDCGSFGLTMLETYKETSEPSIPYIADVIADYMKNKQERREDGAFFRLEEGGLNDYTMWIDDLYMSTPFLSRYYKLTGKLEYIEDAAKQFLLFKKYLFMPEYKIMSHVYDFKYNTPTYIPWGRGNGWVLFSLSEVLEYLPENHKLRPELLAFFNTLSEGYLALQGENGLWHQVLTDKDSYEESSCTAMFTYAFARGVRFGWLKEKEKYSEAVIKAWEALSNITIDKFGNVHGVCMGSPYSFDEDYYKNELLWITNDTHGTGIVMLAGVEARNLMEWVKGNI